MTTPNNYHMDNSHPGQFHIFLWRKLTRGICHGWVFSGVGVVQEEIFLGEFFQGKLGGTVHGGGGYQVMLCALQLSLHVCQNHEFASLYKVTSDEVNETGHAQFSRQESAKVLQV